MTTSTRQRWMKLANIITEQKEVSEEGEDSQEDWDDDSKNITERDYSEYDDDDGFVPGMAAWGGQGHVDAQYEREALANKSIAELKDEGHSDEEILRIIRSV